MAPPHAQSAWGSRGKRVRTAELAACCNYFSKKKKKFCKDASVAKCLQILSEERIESLPICLAGGKGSFTNGKVEVEEKKKKRKKREG